MSVVSESPESALTGLSSDEVAIRLKRDGRNEIPAVHKRSLVLQFASELVHIFALMLWVAGLLALVAGLSQLGIAIFAVVVINAVFSFIQERRSDHAAERLNALLPRRVTVRRDGGPVEVDAGEIVVGDVILLSPGDRISADAVVRLNRGLRLDTSMLTGESERVDIALDDHISGGTFVVDGEAEAEVVATGRNTRLAQISTLTTSTKRPPPPLTTELKRVVQTIGMIAVGAGVTFLVVSLLLGASMSKSIILAIGVTVALIPEGLLPTVTLSLAIGAQRMARHNALVRHLDAVETLGSTTFICTDKTGTLTENHMVAAALWTPAASMTVDGVGYGPTAKLTLQPGTRRSLIDELVLEAARCGTGRAVQDDGVWIAMGDPMEAAMDACATRLAIDIEEDRQARAELIRFPFDATRKRMSSVLHSSDPAELPAVVVKGAVDGVLSLCPDDDVAASCREEADSMTRRGMRVIAVARHAIPAGGALPSDANEAEKDLTLLGLVGLLDPPRPSAFDAVMKCRRAGIKVGMITGDDPHTAFAIGEMVGLVTDGEHVLLGSELPTDIDALGALVDHDGVIISRATPEDKLRIAQALRARGHVVAMTGDGVNDGPALRAASIGVAMGRSGTDVAREAADIVLLDDDFATIVEAIAHGRATFRNVERFLTYHLTDNVAELTPFVLWGLSGGHLPLALTVMQVLALDIGTDTTSATALGAEPPSPHVLDGPPVSGHLLNKRVAIRAFGVLGPTEAVMSMSAFFASYWVTGWRPGDSFAGGTTLYAASGAAFLAVVLGQKANAWACRSTTLTPWRLGWFGNKLLVFTAIGELAFAAVCLGVRPIADALEHRWPPLIGLCVAAASIPAVLLADVLWKRRQARTRSLDWSIAPCQQRSPR